MSYYYYMKLQTYMIRICYNLTTPTTCQGTHLPTWAQQETGRVHIRLVCFLDIGLDLKYIIIYIHKIMLD